jgi:DNA-binding NarL/FixJ family response regulator
MAFARILVVDDCEPWRRFVCATLKAQPQRHVIYQASDGLEAVQKAVELQPDLIVLDLGLPLIDGVEAARQIRRLVPQSRILILTSNDSSQMAREALNRGASGYVVKSDASRQLISAVQAVMQGRRFLSDGIVRGVSAEEFSAGSVAGGVIDISSRKPRKL